MSEGKIRQIRRSQYISPFGVGAILDIGNESFIASDISKWKSGSGQIIHLKRLEYRLHVREFRMPPVSRGFWDKDPAKLPFHRFPKWLFCPSCRTLEHWNIKNEKAGELPLCKNKKCRGAKVLVPMRFVIACENGHLDDVPWDRWVHSGRNIAEDGRCSSQPLDLKFQSKPGVGGGLASLVIYCVKCQRSRSLKGITGEGAIKSIGARCYGKQPWQFIPRGEGSGCDKIPKVLQRGATNLYFPKTISALDIPLGHIDPIINEMEQEIRSHGYFQHIVDKVNSASGDTAMVFCESLAKEIAEEVGCDPQYVLDLANGKDASADGFADQVVIDEDEVLREEWPILVNPPPDSSSDDVFIAEQESLINEDGTYGLNKLLEKLVLVRRLREVRVLRGFHRITPGEEDFVRADLEKHIPWLPAAEVFGEGIFMSFSEQAIIEWVEGQNTAIGNRINAMKKRYEDNRLHFLPEPTPRFVLLHTFAHLLIRQLSFECGYAASSLRERIYSVDPNGENEPMAGILIYTADSDSEGALGGLVRQGNRDRFIPTVLTALERSLWCSADPVCRELSGQGMKGLNRAACHSCALVSETSCTCSNTLLDRMMVIGSDEEHGNYGFFTNVLSEASLRMT